MILYNKNANCNSVTVKACRDLVKLREWRDIINQDLKSMEDQIAQVSIEASQGKYADVQWYRKLLRAKEIQGRFLNEVNHRIRALREQPMPFPQFLLNRIAEEIAPSHFKRILESAKAEYTEIIKTRKVS